MATQPQPVRLPIRLPAELHQLESQLCGRVIGQAHVAREIIAAIARYRGGFAGQDRPAGSFLMLGPTGVGKTLMVEALADLLHGTTKAVLKFHCAEFRSDHELARLKGAPPGYVGWKDCVPLLHQTKLREVRLKNEPALVLFDEVEKAHPALWDLLLGLLDKGEVLLNDNVRSDFRHALIFFTGNTGAREMERELAGGIGFGSGGSTALTLDGFAISAARRLFSPEFRNRLTRTLTFHPLSPDDAIRIAALELDRIITRALVSGGFSLHFSPEMPRWIAARGFNVETGAREIRRTIERYIEEPLSHLICGEQVQAGQQLIAVPAETDIAFLRWPI